MDNLEQIAKLGKLKEKGLISEEEFLKQKKELLNETGVNRKNLFLSFLMALVVLILGSLFNAVCVYLEWPDNSYILFQWAIAIAFAIWAKKLEFSKYKKGAPIWIVLIGTLLLGPIAVWACGYQFLQIKDKNAVLK